MDGKIAIFVFVLIARLGSDQVNAQVCSHPYCRAGYTYSAATNFCYKYVRTPATYAAATQYCANDCAAIASIRFSQENDFLDGYITGAAGAPQKTWIGFTSSGASNNPATWYWTDGSARTYTNWYKNGAPFGNNYQCADFQPTMNGASNFWENSFPCSYSLPFLCKAMPVCSDTVTNGVAKCTYPHCDAGYVYSPVSNLCYRFVQTPLPYQAAAQFCTNDCGAIASIHFGLENDFVDQLILKSNTSPNKKTWIGFAVNTQAVQWQWTDQGPITYTNWYQNKPRTAGCIDGVAPWGNGNGCADFQPTGSGCNGGSNYWENFYSCATALPFVCKQTPICGGAGVGAACINSACNAACIDRGCQSGFCNIGCPNPGENPGDSPCNSVYQYTCTCAFCGTTPCAQPGGTDNKIWEPTCKNIGCQSGDCHGGLTQCVGCPGATGPTSTNKPSPVTTDAIGDCDPITCNSACQALGCYSGGCDLYHSLGNPNPCSCEVCLNPSVPYCLTSNCNAVCKNRGCQEGTCDQGMCGCFVCPS